VKLDCRNCHESLAEPALFDDSFVAVECPVCGVRGPVRALLDKGRFDQVAKLAVDDWNILFNLEPSIANIARIEVRYGEKPPTESTETNGTGKAVTPSAEKPVLDQLETCPQAVTTPRAGEGGEGDSINQIHLRKRLEDFLESAGLTIDVALAKGMKLGTSKATLYRFMSGFKVWASTAAKIDAAISKLERARKLSGAKQAAEPPKPAAVQLQTDYDESVTEQLPNKFKDPIGVNRCPAPTAPPRCGRTP
jgi:hypothetical protein